MSEVTVIDTRPYCADCQGLIEIQSVDPITAKCKCSGWSGRGSLPDWWCMSAGQAAVLGVTL